MCSTKWARPLLIVVLEHGPGLDDQAKLGALLGFLVGAHVITQAVGEASDRNLRVHGN
jgi:hypothetical protein